MVSAAVMYKENDFTILKSNTDLMIGGYASIEMVDKQNDLITLPALKKAASEFMEKAKFRNVMTNHSNGQVGEVVKNYRDKNGRLWKTEVDDVGFFVVIKIRDDIEKAKEVAREIRKGKLRSFSIGGQAIRKRNVHDADVGTYKEIDKLELLEVTICEEGINPEAKFDIVKQMNKGDKMSEEIEKALAEFNGVLSELKKEVGTMQKEFGEGEAPLPEDEPMPELEEGEDVLAADESEEEGDNYADEEEKAEASLPFGGNPTGHFSEWKSRKSTDLGSLDLSNENIEKAYAEFKREREETRAYDIVKNEFVTRYAAEVNAESAQIKKENYDASAEVEILKAQFSDLRESLENTDNVIAKVQEPVQTQVPPHIAESVANIGDLSWADLEDLRKEMGY